jgi:hypothetical protein
MRRGHLLRHGGLDGGLGMHKRELLPGGLFFPNGVRRGNVFNNTYEHLRELCGANVQQTYECHRWPYVL